MSAPRSSAFVTSSSRVMNFVQVTLGSAAWPTGATHMASEAGDVVLSARERNQNREEAMREYLEWEINLVNDMAIDDDHRFQVVA